MQQFNKQQTTDIQDSTKIILIIYNSSRKQKMQQFNKYCNS